MSAVQASATAHQGLVESADHDCAGADEHAAFDGQETCLRPSTEVELARESRDVPTQKVLIVEAVAELAEFIAAALERLQLQVLRAAEYDCAMRVLVHQRPDVILLDIDASDGLGWRLLDEINARDAQHAPPVVVITMRYNATDRLRANRQGVFAYLWKPFALDELERVVIRALESAPDRRGVMSDTLDRPSDSSAG
jgi:DNA-binding NtrC family response regulator